MNSAGVCAGRGDAVAGCADTREARVLEVPWFRVQVLGCLGGSLFGVGYGTSKQSRDV